MRHADENWDDLDESVIIGPSIEEKYTGSRGQHTHKSGNHTMTRSGITIDPLNDVWGPYTEEQQIGIMAHELGHTDARFFTGDKKLTAEINKKNKSYQKVWNELSEEKRRKSLLIILLQLIGGWETIMVKQDFMMHNHMKLDLT